MNIIVRFYWQYNLDLVALAMHPDFDMSYWVKQAITAEARGIKDFSIPLPESQPYSIDLESNYIHFQLDPEEDDDVISYILGIRYGFRNSAIKIIFRKYLEEPFLDVFWNEETYRTKARGKDRRHTPSTAAQTKQSGSGKREQQAGTGEQRKPKPASKYKSEAAKNRKKPSKIPVPDKKEETVDLSKEKQPEDGETFDLFSAFEKMIN